MEKNLRKIFTILSLSYLCLLYFCLTTTFVLQKKIPLKLISDILFVSYIFLLAFFNKVKKSKFSFLIFVLPLLTLAFEIVIFNVLNSYWLGFESLKRILGNEVYESYYGGYGQFYVINAVLILVREPLIAAALTISIIYYVKFCPHKSKGARIAELEREVEELKKK